MTYLVPPKKPTGNDNNYFTSAKSYPKDFTIVLLKQYIGLYTHIIKTKKHGIFYIIKTASFGYLKGLHSKQAMGYMATLQCLALEFQDFGRGIKIEKK